MQQLALALDKSASGTFPADWLYHGTATGYRYGCHCDECSEAHAKSSLDSAARAGLPRTCKHCGVSYVHISNSGTGTRYCAACKRLAYSKVVEWHNALRRGTHTCPGCGVETPDARGRWDLCQTCFGRIPRPFLRSLRQHHAPVEFALKVAASHTCAACGTDVLVKVHDGTRGYDVYRFALDHNHACCPGSSSCGKCLRGLLCMLCNTALGYLRDDLTKARGLAAYIESWPGSDG